MLFYVILFILYPLRCYAVSANKSIEEGNRLYYKGRYDDALKYYNEAENSKVNSGIVNFNKGAALYKKEDYKGAIKFFSKALLNSASKIEERAAYNIGNAKYRLGQIERNTDLSSSIRLYREALDYYKRAIDLDQKDINAKYNYEFVERELKILLDELRHGQKQSHKSRNNKNHRQPHSSKQKQRKKSQKTESKNRKINKKAGESKQRQDKTTQNKEGAKKQKYIQRQAERHKVKQGKMSQEEARMLLNRYDKEEAPHRYINKIKPSEYPAVDKDW